MFLTLTQKQKNRHQICPSHLLSPLARASEALARLDERLAHSPVGTGLIERFHFSDACASLWLDGELVEMEDLILHYAARDIRSPSHALTIARDVLQNRRRIAVQPPDWALSPNGLRSLRQAWPAASLGMVASSPTAKAPRCKRRRMICRSGTARGGRIGCCPALFSTPLMRYWPAPTTCWQR